MEDNKKMSMWWLIAGIIQAIIAVYHIIITCVYGMWDIVYIVFFLIPTAILCVPLFLRIRNYLLLIPLGMITLYNLYFFLHEVSLGIGAIYFISFLLRVLAYAGVCTIGVFCLILDKNDSKVSQIVKRLWFLPAIFLLISQLSMYYDISVFIEYLSFSLVIDRLISIILSPVAILIVCLWMVSPYDIGKTADNYNTSNGFDNTSAYGYCSMLKHVLLLLFTFGIWQYIWIYRTTAYLNTDTEEEYRNPTYKLLLCMFVPFYSIYWIYKSAQRIDRLAVKKQIQSEISTLCLIMAIIMPLVAYIVMQDKINSIVTANSSSNINNTNSTSNTYNTNSTNNTNNTSNTNSVVPADTTVEQIKAYKELLDNGAITQEEYEAKKKQLLGM